MGPRVADEEERKLHVNSGGLGEEEEDEDEETNVGGGGKRSSESSDEPDEAGTADGAGDGEEQLQQRHRHKKPPCQFGNYTRYLVMLLTTLCLSLTMSNSMALNFTVICMSKAVNDDEEAASDAVQQQQQLAAAVSNLTETAANAIAVNAIRPMFNNAEKALLFSAVPVGTLIGTLPITPLTSRFGMRLTFTMYGLISGLATLLTPVAAVNDFGMLLIMRVLQGVAVSICFPASGSIIADWSPLRSAGTYIAFLSCHIQFGPILTMPLAGELCESSWGWPAVYYLQAVLTTLVFGAFYAFYRDSPRLHRNVSQKELCRIERGKPGLDAGPERHEVPYAAMLRDPAVWAVFLCSMGSTFGFHVFMQYGPTYLNQTIKFDVARTGFAMALPCLLSALTKFVVGPASDYATCVSERTRVLLFASVSQFLMAFCFCALALLPSSSPSWLIQCFFTSVTVVSGLNCAGVGKSTQMISRQFAHVITSFSVFVSSITIITIPCIVSVLVPDNLPEQWSRIFLIVAVTVVACVIFFDCTAEASPRPWTFTKKRPTTIQAKTTIVAQKGEMMDKHGNGGKMMPLLIVVPSEGPKQQQKQQQPTTVPPVATNSLANA